MIFLHVFTTKLHTNVSMVIDTPIPTKPSGQKESRVISVLRCVNVGLTVMMLFFENSLKFNSDLKCHR
jgi:hypothetical protein